MRDHGRRLLTGLAVVAVGVMAIGYAFIFSGVATPVRGELGTLAVPPAGDASAEMLDDGRPVFVVNEPNAGARVLDARGREPGASLSGLIAWCPDTRTFVDRLDGSTYTSTGELLDGPADGGLAVFAVRPFEGDPSRIVVGPDTSIQGRADAPDRVSSPDCAGGLVFHEPGANETFDPSVAVDQEPPGWIWLEGTMRLVDGEVRLCDGLDDGCETFAETSGIEPASAADGADGVGGRFVGRVRDGAVEGLSHVPDQVEGP